MDDSHQLADRWERLSRKYEEDNFLLEKQLVETRIERDELKKKFDREKSYGTLKSVLLFVIIVFLGASVFGAAYYYTEFDKLATRYNELKASNMQATSVRDSTINDLRGQVDSLTAQLSQARLDNDTLTQQIQSLTTQLEQKTALLTSLQKAYNALKKKCGSP
jgi:DNA repair exonuclease SbcCD ATPase subunit